MQFSDDVSEDALCSKNWVPLAQAAFKLLVMLYFTHRRVQLSCAVHTYTKSVHQCAQFTKSMLMLLWVHTFRGVYTLGAHFR